MPLLKKNRFQIIKEKKHDTVYLVHLCEIKNLFFRNKIVWSILSLKIH